MRVAHNEAAIQKLLQQMYGGNMAKEVKSKWDDVPEPSDELLVGGYDFLITAVKVTKTTKEPERKMMIAELSVLKPVDLKGAQHAEFFVLGTEDDPDAEDAETLRGSMGARAFKAFCKAAGVQMMNDDEEMCEVLKGEKVFGNVDAPKQAGGRKGVKATGWFPIGDQDPEIREDAPKASKKRKPAEDDDDKPVKKKAVAKKADDDDEDEKPVKRRAKADDDDEDERPAKRKRDDDEDEDEPKAKKGKAKDDDDDEDDEDERPRRGTRR